MGFLLGFVVDVLSFISCFSGFGDGVIYLFIYFLAGLFVGRLAPLSPLFY